MSHPKADEEARCVHREKIEVLKAEGVVIVYLDECGFALDMPRTHGYAPIGKPCYGTYDWHAKGRTNVIGALIGKSLVTVCLFEANITADIFNAWLEQDLLPKLPEKVVIVMDNASFHKRKDTQDMIKEAGHELIFLPPYSPDLNPIEQKWAQLKAMRKSLDKPVDKLFQIESIYMV